jgi:long-chain fatty acid transport protein
MHLSKVGFVLGLSCVCVFGIRAFGGAIDIPQQNARATGQADAFTAQADDASAIHYNPAGLTQLTGTNVSAGATLFLPSWEYHGTAGQEQGMHLPSLLPHIYVESDFGLKKWRFGFGVENDFGLNEDWGTSGPLQTLVQRSHVYNIDMAPTVAYQINDHLSIGAAMNVYYGQLELNRKAVLAAPPVPQGNFHFLGNDFAIGATPGITWKINDENTVAAVYRSGYHMAYSGNGQVGSSVIREIGPSRGHVNLDFPQVATLAYAVRPIVPLKIEADVLWTDWHSVDNITLYSSDVRFRQTIPQKWTSGFTYRLGGQYDLCEHWTVRAGYAYGENAVPGDTFAPLVPDSTYHLASLGLGYYTDKWSIDAAYQFIFRQDRHINNSIYGPLVDGTWSNVFHLFAITYTVKF